MLDYKREPTEKSLAVLREAQSAKQIVLQCTHNFWFTLCQSIQLSSDSGNTGATFEGIKKPLAQVLSRLYHLGLTQVLF